VSITTKKGDKGLTQLACGRKVGKDDIRIDACGTLDELCSFLGLAKSLIKNRSTKKLLEDIQKDLFVLGAEIATQAKFLNRLKERIDNNYVKRLEDNIKHLERELKLKECCFLLPGENFISGTLDVARTIARRAERKIVTLKNKKILKNPQILIYLNRLSNLLYLLARVCEKKHHRLKL
jgi:ATP:cob(I)alamin adenosyltransferase